MTKQNKTLIIFYSVEHTVLQWQPNMEAEIMSIPPALGGQLLKGPTLRSLLG